MTDHAPTNRSTMAAVVNFQDISWHTANAITTVKIMDEAVASDKTNEVLENCEMNIVDALCALAQCLGDFPLLERECLLTAYLVRPSEELFTKLQTYINVLQEGMTTLDSMLQQILSVLANNGHRNSLVNNLSTTRLKDNENDDISIVFEQLMIHKATGSSPNMQISKINNAATAQYSSAFSQTKHVSSINVSGSVTTQGLMNVVEVLEIIRKKLLEWDAVWCNRFTYGCKKTRGQYLGDTLTVPNDELCTTNLIKPNDNIDDECAIIYDSTVGKDNIGLVDNGEQSSNDAKDNRSKLLHNVSLLNSLHHVSDIEDDAHPIENSKRLGPLTNRVEECSTGANQESTENSDAPLSLQIAQCSHNNYLDCADFILNQQDYSGTDYRHQVVCSPCLSGNSFCSKCIHKSETTMTTNYRPGEPLSSAVVTSLETQSSNSLFNASIVQTSIAEVVSSPPTAYSSCEKKSTNKVLDYNLKNIRFRKLVCSKCKNVSVRNLDNNIRFLKLQCSCGHGLTMSFSSSDQPSLNDNLPVLYKINGVNVPTVTSRASEEVRCKHNEVIPNVVSQHSHQSLIKNSDHSANLASSSFSSQCVPFVSRTMVKDPDCGSRIVISPARVIPKSNDTGISKSSVTSVHLPKLVCARCMNVSLCSLHSSVEYLQVVCSCGNSVAMTFSEGQVIRYMPNIQKTIHSTDTSDADLNVVTPCSAASLSSQPHLNLSIQNSKQLATQNSPPAVPQTVMSTDTLSTEKTLQGNSVKDDQNLLNKVIEQAKLSVVSVVGNGTGKECEHEIKSNEDTSLITKRFSEVSADDPVTDGNPVNLNHDKPSSASPPTIFQNEKLMASAPIHSEVDSRNSAHPSKSNVSILLHLTSTQPLASSTSFSACEENIHSCSKKTHHDRNLNHSDFQLHTTSVRGKPIGNDVLLNSVVSTMQKPLGFTSEQKNLLKPCNVQCDDSVGTIDKKIGKLIYEWATLDLSKHDGLLPKTRTLFRKTALIVLSAEWARKMNKLSKLKLSFILHHCIQTVSHFCLESKALIEMLSELLVDPWKNPVLLSILYANEVTEKTSLYKYYCRKENLEVVMLRLELLISVQREDLAQKLCSCHLHHGPLKGNEQLKITNIRLLFRLGRMEHLAKEVQSYTFCEGKQLIAKILQSYEHDRIELAECLNQMLLVHNDMPSSRHESTTLEGDVIEVVEANVAMVEGTVSKLIKKWATLHVSAHCSILQKTRILFRETARLVLSSAWEQQVNACNKSKLALILHQCVQTIASECNESKSLIEALLSLLADPWADPALRSILMADSKIALQEYYCKTANPQVLWLQLEELESIKREDLAQRLCSTFLHCGPLKGNEELQIMNIRLLFRLGHIEELIKEVQSYTNNKRKHLITRILKSDETDKGKLAEFLAGMLADMAHSSDPQSAKKVCLDTDRATTMWPSFPNDDNKIEDCIDACHGTNSKSNPSKHCFPYLYNIKTVPAEPSSHILVSDSELSVNSSPFTLHSSFHTTREKRPLSPNHLSRDFSKPKRSPAQRRMSRRIEDKGRIERLNKNRKTGKAKKLRSTKRNLSKWLCHMRDCKTLEVSTMKRHLRPSRQLTAAPKTVLVPSFKAREHSKQDMPKMVYLLRNQKTCSVEGCS